MSEMTVGALGAPELAPEPEAPAQAAPEAAPEAEAWAPSREEWDYVMSRFAQQEQPPEQEEQEFQLPEIDPLDDNFGQTLYDIIGQAVQQHIAPITEWQQSQQTAEAQERALDILEDIASREGEFYEQEQTFRIAHDLANSFMPEAAQRYGFGPKAAEVALQQAAKFLRDYQDAIGKAYHEKQMNQLTNLSGARTEPGVGSPGAQLVTGQPGGDELDLVRRYTGVAGR